MKRLSKKKIILLSIFTILFFFLFFLSSIVKSYVVNNFVELTGRKLEISELHFNYIKVSVRIKGLKLLEQDASNEFVSFNELYVNVSPWKLISGEYAVSQIYLDGLNVSVIQDSVGFNFDDLITSDETTIVDSTTIDEEKSDLKFAIHDIKFSNGYIVYKDIEKRNKLDLNNINLELPLIAWNNKKSEMGVNFSLGKEGNVSIIADVDHSTERYVIDLGVSSLDISPFVAYLKDYMHVSEMYGKLNTQIKIDGSMVDFMDVYLKGKVKMNDFVLKDTEGNKFLGSQSTIVGLDSMHVGSSYYEIGKIVLTKPEIYAALFKEKSNFESIFAPVMEVDSVNIAIDTLEKKEESELFYSIDSLVVDKGFVEFADHTLNRKFIYDINDIKLNIGRITDKANEIPLNYSIDLNGEGHSEGNVTFSLKNVHNFKFDGTLDRLDLTSFSPYTEFYIARPIKQGEFNYDWSIVMKPKKLINTNKINISEFDFGDKTNDPNTIKAPVRLALYLLKDKNDQINFDLPVSGNPNSPDFKLGKIIWKTLMNFLVKTAAKPFGILGNLAGTNPESIEKMPFEIAQDKLNDNEKLTLHKIATILTKKPELKFTFTQETNIDDEKKMIALRECVSKYFESRALPKRYLVGNELLNWTNSSIEFQNFITKDSTDLDLSVEEKCIRFIGNEKLIGYTDSILLNRNNGVRVYLKDSLNVSNQNFEVRTADLRNLSEQQRKPKYRVEVSLK